MDNDSSSDDGAPLKLPVDIWHMKNSFFSSNSLPHGGKIGTTLVSDSLEIQEPFLTCEEILDDERKKRASLTGERC